jgi:hypothetical protein
LKGIELMFLGFLLFLAFLCTVYCVDCGTGNGGATVQDYFAVAHSSAIVDVTLHIVPLPKAVRAITVYVVDLGPAPHFHQPLHPLSYRLANPHLNPLNLLASHYSTFSTFQPTHLSTFSTTFQSTVHSTYRSTQYKTYSSAHC